MYASTFIFRAGQYDDEFHRLDSRIAEMARATPGYLGEETWENAEAGLIQNVYYRESEAALQPLMRHPAHLEAKAKRARAGWTAIACDLAGAARVWRRQARAAASGTRVMRRARFASPIAIVGESCADVAPYQSASTSSRLLFSQYS